MDDYLGDNGKLKKTFDKRDSLKGEYKVILGISNAIKNWVDTILPFINFINI